MEQTFSVRSDIREVFRWCHACGTFAEDMCMECGANLAGRAVHKLPGGYVCAGHRHPPTAVQTLSGLRARFPHWDIFRTDDAEAVARWNQVEDVRQYLTTGVYMAVFMRHVPGRLENLVLVARSQEGVSEGQYLYHLGQYLAEWEATTDIPLPSAPEPRRRHTEALEALALIRDTISADAPEALPQVLALKAVLDRLAGG